MIVALADDFKAHTMCDSLMVSPGLTEGMSPIVAFEIHRSTPALNQYTHGLRSKRLALFAGLEPGKADSLPVLAAFAVPSLRAVVPIVCQGLFQVCECLLWRALRDFQHERELVTLDAIKLRFQVARRGQLDLVFPGLPQEGNRPVPGKTGIAGCLAKILFLLRCRIQPNLVCSFHKLPTLLSMLFDRFVIHTIGMKNSG